MATVTFVYLPGSGLPDGPPRLLSNLGNFRFLDQELGGDRLEPSSIDLLDVDGDGDVDLLASVAALFGPRFVVLARNDGRGRFDDANEVVSGAVEAIVDLDGDGDLDLIERRRGDGSADVLWFYENGGDGTFAETFLFDLLPLAEFGQPRDLVFADLDGDRDADLAVAASAGHVMLLENDGGQTLVRAAVIEAPAFPGVDPQPGITVTLTALPNASATDGLLADYSVGVFLGQRRFIQFTETLSEAHPGRQDFPVDLRGRRSFTIVDVDGNGREDVITVANPGLVDLYLGGPDGRGDACDVCPGVADASDDDRDGDGIPDACDLCPDDPDPDQTDIDLDGIGDACDRCTDFDFDGLGEGECPPDTCPFVPATDYFDVDGDLILPGCDNCPTDTNPDQSDVDEDGVGDVCDNCPSEPNPEQTDSDGDGTGDACEATLP